MSELPPEHELGEDGEPECTKRIQMGRKLIKNESLCLRGNSCIPLQPASVEAKLLEAQPCRKSSQEGRGGGLHWRKIREPFWNLLCQTFRCETLLGEGGESSPRASVDSGKADMEYVMPFYCCISAFIGSSSLVLRDWKGSLKWISTKGSFICKQCFKMFQLK